MGQQFNVWKTAGLLLRAQKLVVFGLGPHLEHYLEVLEGYKKWLEGRDMKPHEDARTSYYRPPAQEA